MGETVSPARVRKALTKLINLFVSSAIRAWSKCFEKPRFRALKRLGIGGKGIPGLVSIPIATYDRIRVLKDRTLPNLLQQDYQDIEIIVVGDGTPRQQLEELEELEELDSQRVKTIFLPRRSRYPKDPLNLWFVAGSRPRNVGARCARGEFLLWMSDDDVLAPGAISHLVSFLRRNPEYDTVGGITQRGTTNPEYNDPRDKPNEVGHATAAMPGWLHRRYLRMFRWSPQSWRKRWNRPADYDLAERMGRAGAKFGAIPELVGIQVEGPSTGKMGSANSVMEEENRRRRVRTAKLLRGES